MAAKPLGDHPKAAIDDQVKAAIERRHKAELPRGKLASVVMSHVLSREKREQVIALGRLGWSLRCIEQGTGVRRETGDHLRGAGIALRRPAAILSCFITHLTRLLVLAILPNRDFSGHRTRRVTWERLRFRLTILERARFTLHS
jgi:hypothetical protein